MDLDHFLDVFFISFRIVGKYEMATDTFVRGCWFDLGLHFGMLLGVKIAKMGKRNTAKTYLQKNHTGDLTDPGLGPVVP